MSFLRSITTLGAVASLVTIATMSSAQPNPFDDYEEGRPAVPIDDDGSRAPALPPEPSGDLPSPDAQGPEVEDGRAYTMGQFTWTVGLGTQAAYTGTTNELLDGGDQVNRTLFLTLAPRVGFFVVDQVEVTLALGLLSKLSAREGNSSVAENNFFFEAAGHYHISVGETGFALVPGLGLGGYFGSSSREFTVDGQNLDESTKTAGFLLNGYLGAAYMPTPSWRLRSGIAVGALFGNEKIKSQDLQLSASAVHVGLPIEIAYVF